MKTEQTVKLYELRSIDAIHDGDGWSWNASYLAEDEIYLADDITTRQLLKWLRDNGFLSEQSKGKIRIDWGEYYIDPIIEIQTRSGKPFFAFMPIYEEN